MKKSHVAVLLAVLLAAAVAVPAVSAPGPFDKLNKRIANLAKQLRVQKTVIVRASGLADETGFAEASAECPQATQVTGGGGEWAGPDILPTDYLTVSTPDSDGWYVAAHSSRPAGSKLLAYVVCVRLKE
jgi:hypothetical protein